MVTFFARVPSPRMSDTSVLTPLARLRSLISLYVGGREYITWAPLRGADADGRGGLFLISYSGPRAPISNEGHLTDQYLTAMEPNKVLLAPFLGRQHIMSQVWVLRDVTSPAVGMLTLPRGGQPVEVVIQSPLSGRVLDVPGGIAREGGSIQQYAFNGSPSQAFRLFSRSSSSSSSSSIVDVMQRSDDFGSAATEALEAISWARLELLSQRHRMPYSLAAPFPHCVIDGVFPDSLMRVVAREFPVLTAMSGEVACPFGWQCFGDRTFQFRKLTSRHEASWGPATRLTFALLKSAAFVRFLEELTGITGLIPDPMYEGSGLHQTQRGGKLAVHSDFNRHEKLGLDRRVNLFIYLGPADPYSEWREDWGGALELWDRNVSRCYGAILPEFNRLVIFTSSDFSFHGHPEELASPQGQPRRSIALYYYTNGRPDVEVEGDPGCVTAGQEITKPGGLGFERRSCIPTRLQTHSTAWKEPKCDNGTTCSACGGPRVEASVAQVTESGVHGQ